ncbi:MAG TPA: SOS response-associated peptidase [Lacisediminihabitans sp.]|jgi:putative SOS response-associated peptidase YedK|nr:SOS response-associated peptidase [Lacisediminihabitans sp.]HXD62741.1 SOS response-associated peptidase [Lacisediminihabitans sp.]
MCGRFVSSLGNEELGEIFDTTVIGDPIPVPSWHVHPTDRVQFVRQSSNDGVRHLDSAVWNLARPRQDSLAGRPLINIRAESAAQKFGYAMKTHRGIMPASGYFEWQVRAGKKVPYFIHSEGRALAFASLYWWWRDLAVPQDHPGAWVLTAAHITTDAAPHLHSIHDRNPVVLPEEFWGEWLDPHQAGDQSLMDAAVAASVPVAESLDFREVRPFGSKDDGPQLTDAA